MSSDQRNTICLTTVASESFMPGTLVMLFSFLKHNPWFDGDIMIIHDDLTAHSIALLEHSFENINFRKPSAELNERLDKLVSKKSDIANRRARFHSVEMFQKTDYGRIFFCDSDVLFVASIEALFQIDEPLVCCGDGPSMRGNSRDPKTFAERKDGLQSGDLVNCFNAGLMIFDQSKLDEDVYDRLLSMITIETWREVETGHTDQLLYNNYFGGCQNLQGPEYNFMLLHRSDIYDATKTRLSDALVLHFNGKAKPWFADALLKNFMNDPALVNAIKLWFDDYMAFLVKASFGKISPLSSSPDRSNG